MHRSGGTARRSRRGVHRTCVRSELRSSRTKMTRITGPPSREKAVRPRTRVVRRDERESCGARTPNCLTQRVRCDTFSACIAADLRRAIPLSRLQSLYRQHRSCQSARAGSQARLPVSQSAHGGARGGVVTYPRDAPRTDARLPGRTPCLLRDASPRAAAPGSGARSQWLDCPARTDRIGRKRGDGCATLQPSGRVRSGGPA